MLAHLTTTPDADFVSALVSRLVAELAQPRTEADLLEALSR